MTELINKLNKVRDNIAGKAMPRKPNEFPTFYQTSNDFPAMNIIETNSGYRIDMAIPGFSKENINIKTDKNILNIKINYKGEQGRAKDEIEAEQKFSINRSIQIPDEVENDKISASMQNGLLRIELPAKEATIKKRNISIDVD